MEKEVDLTGFQDHDLRLRVQELKRQAFNLRFQKSMGQLKNVRKIREIKYSIARVKTILNSRGIGK